MTNYLAALAFAALIASAACADDTHPAGAKPAPATPAPAARPAATAPTSSPAAAADSPAILNVPVTPDAKTAGAPPGSVPAGTPQYRQTVGSLTFSFEQAGAVSDGSFKKFSTTLYYDEKNIAAGRLDVQVYIASLDTQDKDRDSTLASADLFDAQKYPGARFNGTLAKAGNGIEAVGKLRIRDVAKDVRLPLAIRPTADGVEISGRVKIKRLDFGIGQGEWKSTEWVGDVVTISYKVALKRS